MKPRDEIQDLYFWLGAEAEKVGFTPWRTAAWLAPKRRSAVDCPIHNKPQIGARLPFCPLGDPPLS
jgi:hypothetical protein